MGRPAPVLGDVADDDQWRNTLSRMLLADAADQLSRMTASPGHGPAIYDELHASLRELNAEQARLNRPGQAEAVAAGPIVDHHLGQV